MKKHLALLIAILTVSQTAHAGTGILAGASFHSLSTNNSGSSQSYNSSSKIGFTGGLSFTSDLPLLNLELDALYDNRTLNVGNTGVSSAAIEVPVLVRVSLVPEFLDVGVGPYGAFNVGNNDLGYNSPDFGAEASVRVMIPTPGIHFVIDGRYQFGFTNLSEIPGITVHNREFQILAGVNVPI